MGEHVGASSPRFNLAGRVRGLTTHVADEPVGAAAHVALHRSTVPHARIIEVNVDDALAMPGVYAVVTGDDLYKQLGERMLTGPAFADQPCLAYDKVRYVGEPIAAVLAADLATAREAADTIRSTTRNCLPSTTCPMRSTATRTSTRSCVRRPSSPTFGTCTASATRTSTTNTTSGPATPKLRARQAR